MQQGWGFACRSPVVPLKVRCLAGMDVIVDRPPQTLLTSLSPPLSRQHRGAERPRARPRSEGVGCVERSGEFRVWERCA